MENLPGGYILKEKVMTILESIKKALKKAGVPEKYAGKMQKLFNIENEDKLEEYVSLFKDNILPDLESSENDVQARMEAAGKKVIEKYEKRHGLKDGKPVDSGKTPEETKTDDLPPSVKALIDAQSRQIADLTGVVTNLATSVATSQKQSSADALFKDAKLPEKWFSRVDVNSEKPVEDQIKELKEEWAELRQGIIDDQVEAGNYRPNQYTPKDRTEKEWQDFMEGGKNTSKDASVASLNLDE